MSKEKLRALGESSAALPTEDALREAGVELFTPDVAPSWGERRRVDPKQVDADGRFLQNVVGRDSLIAGIHRMYEDAGQEFDPNFSISNLDEKEWRQITYGIPEELQLGLASAGTRAHLNVLAARLRTQAEAENELAQYGGWGVGGRIALNLVDPVALSVGFGTGGMSYVAKGDRLLNAMRAARAAENLADARTALVGLEAVAKASPWRSTARVAAIAGVENAGLSAAINYGDPSKDGWDVAQAGLFGVFVGGGFSRVFNGREIARLQRGYLAERQLLELAELDATIATRREQLTAHLTALDNDLDVAKARDAVATLQREIEDAAQARRLALTEAAAHAPKRSELAAMEREVAGLRKKSKGEESLEAEVEARMLREDVESMGEEIATSTQRAKLRKGSARLEAGAARTATSDKLKTAQERLSRALIGNTARDQLRKVEKAEQRGNLLERLDESSAATFAARQEAANDALSKALGVQTERKVATQAEIDGLEKVRQAGVKAADKRLASEASVVFGSDTASAARFLGFDEGLHPNLEGVESGLPVVGKMDLAAATRVGPFATLSGILRGSANETVRNAFGRLVGNSIGNKDGSAVTVGASEYAMRLNETLTAKFNTAVNPHYVDWAERNGHGIIGRQLRAIREEFMATVGRHIRGQDATDPAIVAAASKIRPIFATFLKEAKDAGVKGFENVDVRDNYLPRVFDFRQVHQIEKRIGSDAMKLLVQKSMQQANDGLDDALAARLAGFYVTRMKELRVGSDAGLMQGLSFDDVGFLRKFLDDAGVSKSEIDDVAEQFAQLNALRARQDEGGFRSAKRRQQLDENFTMTFRDQEAAAAGRIEDVEITVADLFENNVEALFGRYARSVSGHIGLAKVGIKSRADFDTSMRLVERALNDDPRELASVRKHAEMAYKIVTGQPVQDATALTRLGRAARDWNFATTMNQSGLASVPDLTGMLTAGYLRHTIANFFPTFKTFRRADGAIDDEFYREMEEVIGVGTDFHNNALFSSYDPGEESLAGLPTRSKLGAMADNALGRVEHGLRVAGRGTQVVSGLAFITSFTQRLAARVITQRLVKDVLEGGQFSHARSAVLGLDDALKKRIAAQLKAHTEWVAGDFAESAGKGKVRIVNWQKWDDVEARDAMMFAVYREARRIVQEEDLGDTSLWMHQNWGKIIAQFRRFALVSYSKQLLNGIAMRDAEAGTHMVLSMVTAAMVYKARHEINLAAKSAGGLSSEDQEKYREKYLTWDRYAAASWANSSFSSLTPALVDSTVGASLDMRFFDTRTSGQGSDFLTGNPTYSLITGIGKVASSSVMDPLRGDRQFTEGDAKALRRLLPYQNVLGMDAVFGALTEGLPKKEEDADPDKVDWFFKD